MSQAILGGMIGLTGTVAVAILTALITLRVSEKSRKADLYKIVYPMKIQCVQTLMDKAAVLYRDVWQLTWDGPNEQDKAIEFFNSSLGLFHEAQAQEWLLGPGIKDAVFHFHTVIRRALAPKVFSRNKSHIHGVFEIDDNTWEPISGYIAAFDNLQLTARVELRIGEISRIFPQDQHGGKPDLIMTPQPGHKETVTAHG